MLQKIMNQNRYLNILIIFSLFMQTLFFQVALPSLVLCFGEDGHIGFEWNDTSTKCEFDAPVQQSNFNIEIKDYLEKPETDCTDINLHFHVSFAEKSNNQKHPTITTKSFLPDYNSDLKKLNKYTYPKFQNTIETNHILDNIQSTVLII